MKIDREIMIEKRTERMRAEMLRENIGVLVSFNPETIAYVTGIAVPRRFREMESYYVVFPQKGDFRLFVMGAHDTAMRYPWLKDRVYQSIPINSMFADNSSIEGIVDSIIDVLYSNDLGDMSVAVEGSTNELAFYYQLREAGINMVSGKACVNKARMIKTQEEIECIKESALMSDRIFELAIPMIHKGVDTGVLIENIRSEAVNKGINIPKDITISSGSQTNPPTLRPENHRIEYGSIVNIAIIGHPVNGYSSYLYRSYACGKASEQQKETYAAAYEMLKVCRSNLREGITLSEVYEKMKPYTLKWDFDEFNKYTELCTMHSMGLSLFEYPSFSDITDGAKQTLEEGMLIDAYVWAGYRGGDYGIRINGNAVIGTDEGLNMSESLSPELIECDI